MAENQENQKNQAPVEDTNHIVRTRREKLAELQDAGQDPFEITKFDQEQHSQEIRDDFEKFENQQVSIAGRIMQKRVMGHVALQ